MDPHPTSKPPDSSKKKRSPNWLPSEEEQLARSWIHISKSAEHANNQSGVQFYKQIEEDFNSHSKFTFCDWECIRTRWTSLNTATLKFSAIYQSIERHPPSGSGPMDWMRAAKEMYTQQTKGQQFKVEAAWNVLRTHPKWTGSGAPAQRASSPADESVASSLPIDSNTRPEGVKASKRRCRDTAESSENNKESLAYQRVSALQRSNELSHQQNQLSLKLYKLEQKKVQSDMMANQLSVIMQPEGSCPDEASRRALQLMKKTVLKQLEEGQHDSEEDEGLTDI